MNPFTSPSVVRWELAESTPLTVVYLLAGLYLLSRRRESPRAFTLAGVTLVAVPLCRIGAKFAFDNYWRLTLERAMTDGISPTLPDVMIQVSRTFVIFNVVLDAAAVIALTLAVLMAARARPREA